MPTYDTPMSAPPEDNVVRSFEFNPDLWHVVLDWLSVLASEAQWEEVEGAITIAETLVLIQEQIDANVAGDAAVATGGPLIGQIIEVSWETIPAWALLCDGATYDVEDYPLLFAVIDPAFYVGGTQFKVPDRTARFGLGGVTVGSQGGEAEHTLTIGEMPPHDHPVDIHGTGTAGGIVRGNLTAITSIQTGTTGGGNPHNNMPPYEGTKFIIVAALPE